MRKGHEVYSNLDYWKSQDGYLFNHVEEVGPDVCDVVVMNGVWREYGRDWPAAITAENRTYKTVLYDISDGFFTASFEDEARHFDVIFKQRNTRIKYPSNVKHSSVFGVSDFIANYFDALGEVPKKGGLLNFRHMQPVREDGVELFINRIKNEMAIDDTFEPLDYATNKAGIEKASQEMDLVFQQSGGRHHKDYLDRLSASLICACFGGHYLPPSPFDSSPKMLKLGYYFCRSANAGRLIELVKRTGLQIKRTNRIYQWDSWRLWETFASGAVALHVDFDKYGISLPVMPTNWEHYIGVDFDHPERDVERFLSLSEEEIKRIGKRGQEWALANYGTDAVSQRLLDAVASTR